jgi:hypothetical protein
MNSTSNTQTYTVHAYDPETGEQQFVLNHVFTDFDEVRDVADDLQGRTGFDCQVREGIDFERLEHAPVNFEQPADWPGLVPA